MNGFFDIYTLLFLVLAVVVFLRLRSVLGRRTGQERPPFDPYSRTSEAPASNDKVVTLPQRQGDTRPASRDAAAARHDWGEFAPAGTPLAKGFDAIHAADRTFDPKGFLQGAGAAYEMIVTAFAEGDRKTLKNLLSPEVYENFERAITDRESRGETMSSSFVGIDKAEIKDAGVSGRDAFVTVRFVSELVTVTRDRDGEIIAGDPKRVDETVDVWTFARDTSSRDPNWRLVETSSAD
ncbi:Tim44/TimA family putative adaptor protein [Lutibaculum baratangense]|uniref:Transporter n=1 Tax=Lutibaculum baratangense AMV1 TaxID=631454 RepID=V4RL69_9HYPH|nr:Tim44/TimA family putative adaptor protein [Lutibaculum baratangense]ESR26049.1 Transporter [Lutibaculum baratangense AMV1]